MRRIRIRRVKKGDLERVYEIENLSFSDPYPKIFINTLFYCTTKTFLVADRERDVLGYVIATTQKDVSHVVSIAVTPLERRKGLGRGLLTALLKILQEMGMHSIRLEVRRNNIMAQKFYEAFGFTYAYTIDEYYTDEDALVYYKFL